MKNYLLYFTLIGALLTSCNTKNQSKTELAQKATDFNFDWQFQLIDTTGHTAEWKDVRLPHDWSVEASFGLVIFVSALSYFFIMRISRSMYIHMDVRFDKKYKNPS